MRISQVILRRSFPLLLGVLLIAGSAILYAMNHMAAALDQKITEHSQFLVRKALTHSVERVELEMAKLLVTERIFSDTEGSPPRLTLGAFYKDLGYDGVLLINPAAKATDAFGGESRLALELSEYPNSGLERLLAQAREAGPGGAVAAGFIQVGDTPAVAAAAVVSPTEDTSPHREYAAGSLLLLVDLLASEDILQLGFGYGVADLHVATGDAAAAESSVSLARIDGTPIQFRWTTPGFGEQSFEELWPMMALAALLFALLIGLIARDALRAARQLEEKHTALSASQASLMASETRFRDIAEAASDWLWETDEQTRLVYLSERFEHVTQFSADHWLGRPLDALLQTDSEDVASWLRSHSGSALRCRYSERDGEVRICRVASRPIMVGGRCVGYRGTASDITEEVKAQTEVEHLSMHDALTGLPNRIQLQSFLARKLTAAQPLAMLSLDLDRFKPVNDTLGHAAGDRVLHDISLRLLQCTRNDDLVARLGGDEFIMVLDGMNSQDSIERLCARLIEQLRQPIIYEGQEIYIGGSVGIALAPQDATEASELLRCADIALYQAKADGRATWRFYASEMNQRLVERRQLEIDLRQAIAMGEMRVHYQPRYRTDGLHLIGAEALVRWQHPQRGLLGPADFIALAEETGLIIPLGQWILNEACKEATRWPAHMVVSVNLSVVQFRQSNLRLDVQRALQQTQLPSSRLELEVTESILLDESAGALKTLISLKELGVRLTMDDFGTGYSSLNYLRSYPFDGLKIDRSFITNMLDSIGDQSIIKAIVGLAQALDITVTAEGVETREQLEWLGEENCNEVQGFHMSQPQSAEELALLFGAGTTG
jgi:diguanylate cyclase (GGDEF)-like protein/PAS domain S-box-containing protein